ncbi:hypothetical protein B0T17DRAFT_530547 [Bombardia bombarda]|uniref:Non-canonical purine NTP phosphatase/PRRC1 domain-containing protein n=1 Tax=Bombardia bombarda TaxID=252184 RepID=A0AA39WZR1_9PEZI|nr:hypothetical protein B0T17DRAFT_530547 [Bombardia bombarda]
MHRWKTHMSSGNPFMSPRGTLTSYIIGTIPVNMNHRFVSPLRLFTTISRRGVRCQQYHHFRTPFSKTKMEPHRAMTTASLPPLPATIDELRGKEKIINAPTIMTERPIPSFEPYKFPQHGDNILVIIPTANKDKTRILKSAFEKAGDKAPPGAEIHYTVVPVQSNVGEQPYNEAGPQGAFNRITNALNEFQNSSEKLAELEEKKIGTVIAAAIENFIQTKDLENGPADFGMVMLHNARTGKTVKALSEGVTVSREYVEHARTEGYEDGNENHGKMTVGYKLKEKLEDLDPADWHTLFVGKSRYEILTEAIDGLEVPW